MQVIEKNDFTIKIPGGVSVLEKELLSAVLDTAMQKGSQFAEIYVEDKKLSGIFCEDNRIEKINCGREKGVGIRVVKNYKTAYVYTNDLSRDGLLRAAARAAHANEGNHVSAVEPIGLVAKKPNFTIEFKKLPEKVSFNKKIEKVLIANQAAREMGPEIRQVTVTAADVQKTIQIANSDGELVEEETSRVRIAVNTIACRDGAIQTGYESTAGVCGWELLDRVSFEEMAAKAARLSVNMLSARPAPAGKMPVVMSAQAGGTMVHEACGHGLEADLVHKGLSIYKGKIGQKVASTGVSVIDDATLAGNFGSYRFDDEGCHAQRTTLIDDGTLVQYMYDRLSAEKDGRASTGNGRRESYQHKPVPRMSNTMIVPGSDDPEEIIKSTANGLLVGKMGGGQVNTINGDFVFEVQEAYIIEDGQVTHPVRGATLTGNGPQSLNKIDRIGHDLGFAVGVCGKEGQGVPVSDAQPTIRITELIVGGTKVAGHSCGRIRRV